MVQNRTHVYVHFYRKDLVNHLLQLCPQIMNQTAYTTYIHTTIIHTYILLIQREDNCNSQHLKVTTAGDIHSRHRHLCTAAFNMADRPLHGAESR
jgi:hypothetical protein